MPIYLTQNDDGKAVETQLFDKGGKLVTENGVDRVLFVMSNGMEVHSHFRPDQEGVLWTVFSKDHLAQWGRFQADYKVFYDDGRIETFPDASYITVNIKKDLRR